MEITDLTALDVDRSDIALDGTGGFSGRAITYNKPIKTFVGRVLFRPGAMVNMGDEASVPLLRNHNMGDRVYGRVTLANGEGAVTASGEFAPTDAGKDARAETAYLAEWGMANLSLGIDVVSAEPPNAAELALGASHTVTAFRAKELSLVAMGADDAAKITQVLCEQCDAAASNSARIAELRGTLSMGELVDVSTEDKLRDFFTGVSRALGYSDEWIASQLAGDGESRSAKMADLDGEGGAPPDAEVVSGEYADRDIVAWTESVLALSG